MYSRSSYCVSTRIFACGFSLRISMVASRPPRPGIAMSIRMTSGASCRRAGRSPRCPLAASPTTVDVVRQRQQRADAFADDRVVIGDQDPDAAHARNLLARPGRVTAMRVPLARAPSRARACRRTARRARACPSRPRPRSRAAGGGRLAGREPLAVVLDLDRDPAVALEALDEHGLGARVLGDVGDRLLRDAEERRLELGHQPAAEPLNSQRTAMPRGSRWRSAYQRMADSRPRSSSTDGRRSKMSRCSSSSVRTVSCLRLDQPVA